MKFPNKALVLVVATALSVPIVVAFFICLNSEPIVSDANGNLSKEQFAEIAEAADVIAKFKLLPTEGYWDEFRAAAIEDEKEGYHPRVSYPGRRAAGSISITRRDWRPDTSKYGPRLKEVAEKWRPVIEQNFDVGEKRRELIVALCRMLREARPICSEDDFGVLLSEVAVRAGLSSEEFRLLPHSAAEIEGDAQGKRRLP